MYARTSGGRHATSRHKRRKKAGERASERGGSSKDSYQSHTKKRNTSTKTLAISRERPTLPNAVSPRMEIDYGARLARRSMNSAARPGSAMPPHRHEAAWPGATLVLVRSSKSKYSWPYRLGFLSLAKLSRSWWDPTDTVWMWRHVAVSRRCHALLSMWF